MKESRRDFMKMAGAAAVASCLPFSAVRSGAELQKPAAPPLPFDIGLASYTFRAFTLEEVLGMSKRLGVKKLTLKEMHLPLKSTEAEIVAAREKINAAGLELDSVGVIYMKTEDEIKQAFTYAKAAGAKMIVGAPEAALIGIADRFVRETDIILAIHNHGPTDKRYPTPESAYRLIEKLDKRMGLCIDVGHTQRHGLDPSVETERFIDRVYDIHIKDVDMAEAAGKTVEIGRGVIDIPKLMKMLVRLKYAHTLHLEFEKDQTDPLPGTSESLGYVRGVVTTL